MLLELASALPPCLASWDCFSNSSRKLPRLCRVATLCLLEDLVEGCLHGLATAASLGSNPSRAEIFCRKIVMQPSTLDFYSPPTKDGELFLGSYFNKIVLWYSPAMKRLKRCQDNCGWRNKVEDGSHQL